MEQNTELTMDQIENIVNAAESAIPEGGIDMRHIQDTVEVNENAELESSEVIEDTCGNIVSDTGDEIDKIAKSFEDLTSDVSIFDVENGTDSPVNMEEVSDTVASNAKNSFDLSDEDALKVFEVINRMNEDPKYNVYANLPEKMQAVVSKLAYENNVPILKIDMVARAMMEELAKEAGIDKVLVDFEKSLNEALKMPSILDLYSEHTRDVMDNIIPQTIENIKDEFPEKAKKLECVRAAFKDSYNFKSAKEAYENNSRLRKAVRRFNLEFKRCMDKFNYMNEKTNFKMNDVTNVPEVLKKLLIDDAIMEYNMYISDDKTPTDICSKIHDMNITEDDIKKFCVLICKSCENRDPSDVIDAAYMYYMVRNIIVLRHSQEAKTEFSVELINNICDTIMYIRDKESEFNGSNAR